jgi:peptide deformylase
MSELNVVKYGDPILRKKCQPIKAITPEIKNLISDMLETLYAYRGVGLAACQVGVPVRLCVIDVRPEGKRQPMVLINPVIVEGKGMAKAVEGCLSLPGLSTLVKRFDTVKVNAINENGFPIVIEGKDLLSRALQHELDHLDGKVFLSRIPVYQKLKIQYLIRKLKKQGKW